jgi:hypothetical protein
MASQSSVQTCQARIARIKRQLQALGPMRPGSVSRQYRICGKPNCRCVHPTHPQLHGPYHQVNYCYTGKKTAYWVQKENLKEVRAELANYKKFRRLTNEWVGLTVQIADLKRERSR